MRTLVTGASGFVGRHLRAHLRDVGDDDVTPLQRCDITDVAALRTLVATTQPEVIFHLAARSSVAASYAAPDVFTATNVVGTLNVLRAVHDGAPAALTIIVSSSEVYGMPVADDLPLNEHARIAPMSPYATSKVEAELAALDAHRHRGQRVIVVRPFTHIGPGQMPPFFVPSLIDRLLTVGAGESVPVGNLHVRRDVTDVRDVVRAYRLLSVFGQPGETYNVASGQDCGLEEIANELREAICPTAVFAEDPRLLRPVDAPVVRGDPRKIHDVCGWEPAIRLHDTLRDSIEERRRASRSGSGIPRQL